MANIGNIAYPQPTFTAAGTATRTLGTLPTPLTNVPGTFGVSRGSFQQGIRDSMGVVPPNGIITIEVDRACIVQINLFTKFTLMWLPPGSGSSSYQKTFTQRGFDFFIAKPGELFYMTTDTASVAAATDGDTYPAVPHPLAR